MKGKHHELIMDAWSDIEFEHILRFNLVLVTPLSLHYFSWAGKRQANVG